MSPAGGSIPSRSRVPSPSGPDDQDLVARLRQGDERAFETLVRTYGPRLRAVAQRLLQDRAEAEDALQEALLSAFRSLAQFKGEARLSTWLHRIVVNVSFMRLRSRRRKPEESIEPLLPTFLADGHQAKPGGRWNPNPEEELGRKETCARVREAIGRLPESYRTVLILRDIEELDTEESAQLLGTSITATKIRLHRARQALRTLLARQFE
jgi:RNA polymerase sigma-70 factor (ECF subfamily)